MAAGGGSHAQQTAKIMVAFEELCQGERPDAVLVVGDVNSTLACSIVAKKLNHSGGPCRSRPAQRRHDHAGGDQPACDGQYFRLVLRHRAEWCCAFAA